MKGLNDLGEALQLAESVSDIQAVEGFSRRPSLQLKRDVTVSIGVAIYLDSGETIEYLLAASDAALYASKEGGRNQVRLYNSSD